VFHNEDASGHVETVVETALVAADHLGRCELPQLCALKFVLTDTLGGKPS
jgi:hypothetical protein